MNRKSLQELSNIRLKEAKHLLDHQLYDGAYYLCGYSIECALKACIAKKTKMHDFPEKKAVLESYSHELYKLVKVAGLEFELNDEVKGNEKFKINWNIVKDWSHESRYKKNTRLEAIDLYSAINNKNNGLMSWIKKRW